MWCVILWRALTLHAFVHFLAQCQTLCDAETMLLVNHRQAQIIELHRILNQRVRTDDNLHFVGSERGVNFSLGFFLDAGCEPCDVNAERREPTVKFFKQLLGQNFGRCHHGGLSSCRDALRAGERGEHGFTRADIALQQSMHRIIGNHVLLNLRPRTRLRASHFEWQLRNEAIEHIALCSQTRRAFSAAFEFGLCE